MLIHSRVWYVFFVPVAIAISEESGRHSNPYHVVGTGALLPIGLNQHQVLVSALHDSPHSVDQSSIVYPGVQHPNFGSISELQTMIRRIHSYGMQVVIDFDLSGFDAFSDWYNYDGSSKPSAYGPLFLNSTEYKYDGRTARALALESTSPAYMAVEDILYEYSETLDFDGVYWKGLLCFRLDSVDCASGRGDDIDVNVALLRRVVHDYQGMFSIWVGAEKACDA